MKRLAIASILSSVLTAPSIADEDRVLDFPQDYREKFTLYFTGDRLFEEEQTIRIFANDIALEGAKTDGRLPDGSILVAELYAALKDGDGNVAESAVGRRLPGKFQAIAIMERRNGWDAQYSDDLKVGDWEFEVFSTAGENLNKDTTGCRECHNPLVETDYLWSIEHLKAAVN